MAESSSSTTKLQLPHLLLTKFLPLIFVSCLAPSALTFPFLVAGLLSLSFLPFLHLRPQNYTHNKPQFFEPCFASNHVSPRTTFRLKLKHRDTSIAGGNKWRPQLSNRRAQSHGVVPSTVDGPTQPNRLGRGRREENWGCLWCVSGRCKMWCSMMQEEGVRGANQSRSFSLCVCSGRDTDGRKRCP